MLTGSKQRNNKMNKKKIQINLSFKKTVCVGEVIIILCIQGLFMRDVVALFESLCPMAFYYVAKFIRKINCTCTLCLISDPLINIYMNNTFLLFFLSISGNKTPIYIRNLNNSPVRE